MKINKVSDTKIQGVKIITYARFMDERGFFTESYNKNEFTQNSSISFLKDSVVIQANVSYSKKNVVRGLHFQWNPNMEKLVRVIDGAMIDLFLDIRKNSATYGKIDGYLLEASPEKSENTLIWLPEGIAHGCIFLENAYIEYYCNAAYNPKTQGTISPFSSTIDWSLIDMDLKSKVDEVLKKPIISQKDKNGLTLDEWSKTPESKIFA